MILYGEQFLKIKLQPGLGKRAKESWKREPVGSWVSQGGLHRGEEI